MKTQPRSKVDNRISRFQLARLRASGDSGPGWRGLVAGVIFLATLATANAQAPSAINYQGKLSTSDGGAVVPGYYMVYFRIWTSLSDTNSGGYVWGRSFPVNVTTNGMFNALLDDTGSQVNDPGVPRTNSLLGAFLEPNRYLGLSIASVNGTTVSPVREISPRQQLVSAPYALHSSTASSAGSAVTASYSGSASNATSAEYAGNATNFSGFTTNDFLRTTYPQQTLKGSLTVQNQLSVLGPLVVSGTTIIDAALETYQQVNAYGPVSTYGALNVTAGMNGHGKVVWGSSPATNPIVIKQFTLPTILATATAPAPFDTQFSTNDWTAVIAGFAFDGNIADSNIRKPLMEIRTVTRNPNWHISFFLWPEQDLTNIKVDVMFIRREFATDLRPGS